MVEEDTGGEALYKSLDRWDGELELEEGTYTNSISDIDFSKYKNKVKEGMKSFRENIDDYLGASSLIGYKWMEANCDWFQAEDLEDYHADKLFHFALSYGITGMVYEGMESAATYAENKEWEKAFDILTNDKVKFWTAFSVLNSLGAAKEFLIDGGMEIKDMGVNNLGFFARSYKEFGREGDDLLREFSLLSSHGSEQPAE